MKWSDIPDAAKISVGVVVGVVAVMGYLTTYQTDLEADDYRNQHQSELVNIRVQQIEQNISGYRYQLLSTQLTPAQREWILLEIRRLEDLLNCIRERNC